MSTEPKKPQQDQVKKDGGHGHGGGCGCGSTHK